jgi:hypothetical protein
MIDIHCNPLRKGLERSIVNPRSAGVALKNITIRSADFSRIEIHSVLNII